jgi:hypothetical protein
VETIYEVLNLTFSGGEMTVKSKQPDNNEILLEDKWISVKSWGNRWSGQNLYINPVRNKAKIHSHEITRWGYHDECDEEEHEEIISIERALEMVYNDDKAISIILNNSNKDYEQVIEQIKSRGEI